MKHVSYFARHEPASFLHVCVLTFHGIWALCCWVVFIAQWLSPKGTQSHKRRGRWIFWGFLVPLELTGLYLVPFLLSSVPRSNIVMSSGYLVVPSMGFHFLVTTFRAFPFLRNRFVETFFKWFSLVNFGLQLLGSSALAYKVFYHIEHGMHHENNIELFIITLPFSIMQAILIFRPHLRYLGHTFFIKYLTLQMFPGTMIVISRDKYWFWGQNGLQSLHARILIEFLPMVPLMLMVWPTLLAPRKKVV